MKILYSRTQATVGQTGGGAVAHTLGVIDGLSRISELAIITNSALYGVKDLDRQIPTTIVEPLGHRGLSEFLYNLYYPRHLRAKILDFQPDFVYHRYGGLSYATASVCRQLNMPLVLEFNSSANWGLAQRTKSPLDRLLLPPKRLLLGLIESYNVRSAYLIVVVSNPLKEYLIENKIPGDRILVNPNAVNPSKFQPAPPNVCQDLRQELGIEIGKTVVGFAGSFSYWHGIPILAEAIQHINSDSQRQQFFFVFYGDGRLRKDIETRIGHYENVKFTGRVEHARMPDYLSVCDFLLSPHEKPAGGESFIGSPTKIFEYMAMGKGIIASDLDQIGEILRHEETALLVPPSDVDSLVRAIYHLADHPEKALQLGKKARATVCQKYTWAHNAQRVVHKFKELASTDQPSHNDSTRDYLC